MSSSRRAEAQRNPSYAENVITYNEVLKGTYSRPHGFMVYCQARDKGIYGNLCSKGPTSLDVHGMSRGAAEMAVKCWLLETLPAQLSSKKPKTCTIITGWGKSRPSWKWDSDPCFLESVKLSVMVMLGRHDLVATPTHNPGLLRLELRAQDLEAFRASLASEGSDSDSDSRSYQALETPSSEAIPVSSRELATKKKKKKRDKSETTVLDSWTYYLVWWTQNPSSRIHSIWSRFRTNFETHSFCLYRV